MGDEILQMLPGVRRCLDEVGYVLVEADVRLRDAFPCQLARSGLVDWGALLGIMHAATEDGREPFAEAIRVQTRLFTTRPITLGVENALEHPDAPCGLATDAERAKHVRKQDKEILNSRGEWERQPRREEVLLRDIHVPMGKPREGEAADLQPLLSQSDVLGDSARRLSIIDPIATPAIYGCVSTVAERNEGKLIIQRWVRCALVGARP